MSQMTYLIIAYAIAWIGLFAYLAVIVLRLQGVRMELAAVEELVHEQQQEEEAK
ncbi:MAG: CcmD family protein [Chloroflexi bacterium]|nr:MAG: CcmD family protein [Chloroflexota bacterium]